MSQRAGRQSRLPLSGVRPSALMRAGWMDRWTGMRRVRAQLALVSLALAMTGVGSALASPAASASPYTISRYAGIVNNTSSGATPGPATSTPIGFPGGTAIDSSGNVYVTDDSNTSEVYKITPSGTLSIIAGDGSVGSPTPGSATSSHLYQPSGVAVDSAGNVYIADANNFVIEKVTPSGVLSIFAGNGSSGNAVAGPATSTPLGIPTAVAVDSSGNLYIADRGNNQVYKVDTSGILSIIGGDGTSSSGGGPGGSPLPAVPGPATSSPLDGPAGVAVDSSGDVFVSLTNPAEVVKILPSGNLSVVAGTGTSGMPVEGPATSTTLGSPAGVAVDGGGDVYIADIDWEYVEEVTPDGTLSFVAGDGNQSTPTFGGPATASALDAPYGIASDPLGRIYFTDSANYTLDLLVSAAPVNTAVPTVSGTVNPGDTVTATEGTWSNGPVLFSYQWQDCDATGANCTDITGATTSSYAVSSSDAGHTLRVVVTAQNSGGDAPAGSAVTAAVPVPVTTTTTTTPSTTTPAGAPPVTLGSVPSAGIRVSGSGIAILSLVCPQTSTGCDASGVLTIHLPNTLAANDASASAGGTVLASFSGAMIASGHSALVTVRLSPAVLQRLQSLYIRRVKVTLSLSNHLTGGPTVNSTQTVYLLIPPLTPARCADPTGQLNATTLGAVTLGATRTRTHQMLPRFTVRSYHTDNFCLSGGPGIRVGYASARLLGTSSTAKLTGTVVLALSANRFYTLRGVRPGTRLATAAHQLKLVKPIRWGANDWYVISGATSNGLLKVRHGVIQEVGIVNKHLTSGSAAQLRLLRNF
jgi:sugar lactone lactonase YvrE